jgi:hypothetical protein
MRETVAEHIELAREEHKPTLVEAFTYRFRGHSAADPEVYRTKEEVEEWRRKDPIEAFANRLEKEGILGEGERDELRERIERRIAETVEFADNSPEPPLESLYENLYVIGDQVPGWYAVDERTPETHPGEREHEIGAEGHVRELAEAGAAYAGRAASTGRQPSDETGDRKEGEAPEDEGAGEPEEDEA